DVFQVLNHRKLNKKGALSTIPGERAEEENLKRDRLEVERMEGVLFITITKGQQASKEGKKD
ncbi:unnamed protein product, partial [Dovyalis caffra]